MELGVSQTSPGIAHKGPGTQPDFAYKIFGPAPYQGGAEKRNYEKFGGQSIDYGGGGRSPTRVMGSGAENPSGCDRGPPQGAGQWGSPRYHCPYLGFSYFPDAPLSSIGGPILFPGASNRIIFPVTPYIGTTSPFLFISTFIPGVVTATSIMLVFFIRSWVALT